MKHYNNRYNNKIIKSLTKDGFICKHPGNKNGNKYFIYKEKGPKFLVHSGDAIIHLKQWLKKEYNYELFN